MKAGRYLSLDEMGKMNHSTYDVTVEVLEQRLSPEEVTELAIAAKTNQEAKLALLEAFDGYLKKYVGLIRGTISLDQDNHDTRQFKQLFVSAKNLQFYSPSRLSKMLRSLYQMVDEKEVKQDLVEDFLRAIDKFPPEASKGGFLSYVVQYIRWKAKDKILASMNQPLNLTNWNAIPFKGASSFRSKYVNPIELEHFQHTVEPLFYDGLSEMDLAWVNQCDDPLFKDLSSHSRYILYLRFKCGQTFDEIAATLRRSPRTVSEQYKRVINRLRLMAQRDGALEDPALVTEEDMTDEDCDCD